MRPRRDQAPVWRAIIAMVALYAILLQPFLAAMAGGLGPSSAAYLCSSDKTGGPAHDGAANQADHQCCTAAQPTGAALPPAIDGAAVVWPARRGDVLSWRLEAERRKTGPPTHAHAPRGPPSA
jgi:hypothetical protein